MSTSSFEKPRTVDWLSTDRVGTSHKVLQINPALESPWPMQWWEAQT